MHKLTTQAQIRAAFWDYYPELGPIKGKTQNDYPADTRMLFCDFVDMLCRDSVISETLADKVTL